MKGAQHPPVRRARFIEEYLVDCNATAAAIRAGYSPRAAHVSGIRLLKDPRVATALREARIARSERTQVKADQVLEELARLGFSDMRDFMTWGPEGVKLLPYEILTPAQAACVAEVSQTITQHGGTIRLKLHDKLGALRALAEHLGMLDNPDKKVPVDIRQVLINKLNLIIQRNEARPTLPAAVTVPTNGGQP